MDLLDLARQHVSLRKVGSEWHGACPACGSGKSGPEKTDRFSVKPDGRFFCRSCTPSGGDAVAFLRKFEGKSCPEAHVALGLECHSATCPVANKCRKGRDQAPKRDDRQRQTAAPAESRGPVWAPVEATEPAELWRSNASRLVEWAHERLLLEPDQLAWLAARGLPVDAVRKYRLGWWPETKFKTLSSWGLPEERHTTTGKPRRLWLPRGLVIPTFHGNRVDRVRIRRHSEDLGDGLGKYVALKGSSDDVPVYGADRRGFVVVESDLDGLLIDWLAGDLVGSVPLASCSVKPRSRAAAVLEQALVILVALDFEPRHNEKTGKYENPGGHSAIWWKKTYRQSKRWPTPSGKDPGEFFQDHGGDIRAWVLQGLPPGLRVRVAPATATAPVPVAAAAPDVATVDPEGPKCWTLESRSGRVFHVVETEQQARLVAAQRPGEAVFTAADIQAIKDAGLSPEEAEPILLVRQMFGYGRALDIRPVTGDGLVEAARFDPARQRASQRRRV